MLDGCHGPLIKYNEHLPIFSRKNEIVAAIRQHQVIIVTGETGSGKTTQIPKMCLEAGRGVKGLIGCTQPRRVAAVSVAYRMAEELGEEVGKTVAYRIRFSEKSSSNSKIKVMTDGILLAELATDRLLRRYDTIIVDEAHERSINIDFVLGYLKSILPVRRDLKIIITSATIDTEKFSRAFNGAPVIETSGRLYPVEIIWRPLAPEKEESGEYTYLEGAIEAVDFLFSHLKPADTLIFLPTEQDIRELCDILEHRLKEQAIVLPLFARLPLPEQRKVFLTYRRPKVICATNVAETSLTIPGIHYVVDSGLARISWYNPRTKTAGLPIRPISRSSADQRSGRCGRVTNGVCVRLYSEEDYLNRPLFTTPEILRSNFAGVLLQLLYLKLGNITEFPFIDQPPKKRITDAIDTLRELGALDDGERLALTPLGKIMARLPLDPRMSRMVIEGIRRHCSEEAVTVAAVLGIGDPREAGEEKVIPRFSDSTSDFLSLLTIWQEMQTNLGGSRSQTKLRKYCREHHLSFRRIKEWIEVRDQIKAILAEEPNLKNLSKEKVEGLYPALHKSILSGYLSNIGEKKERNVYQGTRGREFMIFPGSGLFRGGGKWVVASEIVATSRLYARMVANIEPEWIEEVGRHLCRYTYSDPFWDPEREDVMAREKVTCLGLTICHGRNVSYSRINEQEAHPIFIRDGLMKGLVKSRFRFLRHNLDLVDRLRQIEEKMRMRGIIDEEAIFAFYSERLGAIANVTKLKKLIQKRGGDSFLLLKEEDCMAQKIPEEAAHYPDCISLFDHTLPLTYRFAPGHPEDGANLSIPAYLLRKISSSLLDRLIPGLLREKIEFLIKNLPKEYRRKLPSPSEWLDRAYERIKDEPLPLHQSLSRFVREKFRIQIPSHIWALDRLPDHLKVRISVVDENGIPIAAGREIEEIKDRVIESKISDASRELRSRWERAGLNDWDFDSLPEKIFFEGPAGIILIQYPALCISDSGVAIKLFSSSEEAEAHHARGVARLYELSLPQDMKYLKKTLKAGGKLKEYGDLCWGTGKLEACLYEKVIRDVLALPLRQRTDFLEKKEEIRRRLIPRAYEVMELARPVVESAMETKLVLKRIRQKEGGTPLIKKFLQEIEEEWSRLAPVDFLLRFEESRLPHLIRYLKALAIRAERGVLNLEKDKKKKEEISFFEAKLAALEVREEVDKKRLDELKWMLEEFRISLFAQEIKTAFPVSAKRLREKIEELES
ncbi:MAG: ATP-dependent RNA helicase HrpA [Syntrophales bacterium]|nr:ATP-dependent RNA helicase HrpA [Syntrophales bacterium]